MSTDIKTGEKMIVFIVNKKEYAISVSEVKSIEKWRDRQEFLALPLIYAVLLIYAVS